MLAFSLSLANENIKKSHSIYFSAVIFTKRIKIIRTKKAHISKQGCELNRIGRSRHWQLKSKL